MSAQPTLLQRWLLPGLAFKAVVIGGGYATGRELVEFFLPHGPQGGLMAMALATAVWSLVCVLTFLFAHLTRSEDYRNFFAQLLGPFWVAFEAAYLGFLVLILSVFGAAAGAVGAATLGLPPLAGTIALAGAIALVTALGNHAVERMFKYVSYLLYATYVLFFVLALSSFGDKMLAGLQMAAPTDGWVGGGLTYAGYNIIGAVVILPMIRHLTGPRDAVIAGVLAGPLAMLPALLFFLCMVGYYPQIEAEALPSDFLLTQLQMPAFRLLFQLMIFAALLESGAGAVHAVNERLASAAAQRGRQFSTAMRTGASVAILLIAIFVADRIGLVALIAKGYRLVALVFLLTFVAPLLTIGAWRIFGLTRPKELQIENAN